MNNNIYIYKWMYYFIHINSEIFQNFFIHFSTKLITKLVSYTCNTKLSFRKDIFKKIYTK